MPYNIGGTDSIIDLGETTKYDYEYDYPNKLNFKPGSELHQFIISRVRRYARESSRVISKRHKAWREIDDKLTGFIPTSEKEKKVKANDSRKPISIVFPYSYAIHETLISYMIAAFLPEPVFRYEGTGPEDIAGAMLMEKVINLHCSRTKVALALHTMFRDATAYGVGAVSPQWMQKHGKRTVKKSYGRTDELGRVIQEGFSKATEEVILFEGNSLHNIDPYLFLPDPSVPIHDVQSGEFVGWGDRTNYLDLLSDEQQDDEMFNVRYLKHLRNKQSNIFEADIGSSNRNRRSPNSQDIAVGVTEPVDLINMYVKLIPRDWKLGSSRVPEKWLFQIAGDCLVIKAKPLGLNHDMFPVGVCAPDFDGYSPIAYSRLETLQGLQVVIDWLFNSHIANVRKAINDVIIIDPYLVNIEDLKDPEPGGLVRLRRPAWGRGVENVAKQLAITDITARNMEDVALTIQYMQQIGGTDNPVMGNLRTGGPERLTGAEFKGTAQGAVSRLERIAKVIGLQGMQDIGYQFAHNSQQLMEKEVYVKTTGQWPDFIQQNFSIQQGKVLVSPYDILVDYDLLVRDGSIPGGNNADIWVQIFKIVSENPLLAQQFDVVRIFEHIATDLGAKNVEDFRNKTQQPQMVQPQVAPDEQVQQQVQAGNLTPVNGAVNGQGSY